MIDEIDEDGSGTVDFEGFKFKHIFFFKLIYSIFIENFTEFMEMMVTVLNQFKIKSFKSFNYFNFADWLNGIQSSR